MVLANYKISIFRQNQYILMVFWRVIIDVSAAIARSRACGLCPLLDWFGRSVNSKFVKCICRNTHLSTVITLYAGVWSRRK